MAKTHYDPNAQSIMKSKRATDLLKKDLTRRTEEANRRLGELKEAGFSDSQFYQNHKRGFKDARYLDRADISKRLAKVNQFLNAKSSTVAGLKKARRDTIKALNESERVPVKITEQNLNKFLQFMDYYHNNVEKQMKIPSDFIVEMFGLHEKLHIDFMDLMKNMDEVAHFQHVLKDMKFEDMFPDKESIDTKRRFKVADYLDRIFW